MKITELPSDLELVIFDFYDTIMHTLYYNHHTVRRGVAELVSYLDSENVPLVISSDGDEYEIDRDFGYTGTRQDQEIYPSIVEFQEIFRKIYGRKHLLFSQEEKRLYKNLVGICNDMRVDPSEAVFIGDDHSGMSSFSAEKCGVDYIIIPKHADDPQYSFAELIHGQ